MPTELDESERVGSEDSTKSTFGEYLMSVAGMWEVQRPCQPQDCMQMIFAANCLLGFSRPLLSNLPTSAKVNIPMPLPDFSGRSPSRLASVTSTGSSSVSRSTASMGTSRYRQSSKALDNRRVVRQEIICAGSIRVRSCKLLWKPAALQLMVTTTSSLGEDEAHFDNCDDDSDDSDDDDIDKVTTMAQPNETHHYSITFCHRSLMGHARREKIELNGTRDPVEIICGEDGLLSTRFEFSIAYGSVGPSGRRRTLTCRARDAKEYLQWTEALRMAVEAQGKNKIATIIAQFVDTFTRPIANEDNVNFIPNAGPYALYDLYCKVVQDKKFHPKREDVFYKMTSLHCKVDRQRVNRYYMCPVVNGVGTMFVQCKPQGKGVLLRRYRKVGVAEELEDVVKAAPFVSWLGLDPNEVVVLYTSFIEGFVPITKRNYRVEYGNAFT
ncbi:hypothetical protein PPTG_23879 [Phytophthora nicotianae INRA-310]|uniref:PH domain-containing protein n=1 Tax=Phytophthora nicotianae (strain INRA-310) TaxID=761204 RepID=W2PRU6_PHYN3|nr:hypothetical protein PPTG_23879 [Phytophthora nicotianae INRA-310]ETN02735.1 hypothetical protein PPTG_23879 [Phytophthora nicotianae INRA-310]